MIASTTPRNNVFGSGSESFRTIVGVPIESEDQVIAVISLWRRDVNLFEDREIELATTFAAQGEIAIRNASLMQQLDQRTQRTRAVGRPVERAEQGCRSCELQSRSRGGAVNDRRGMLSSSPARREARSSSSTTSSQEFRVRTAYGTSEELLDALRATKVVIRDSLVPVHEGAQRVPGGAVHELPEDLREARRRSRTPPENAVSGGRRKNSRRASPTALLLAGVQAPRTHRQLAVVATASVRVFF